MSNALRWDCDKRGCFNVKKRPKIEIFGECFGRGINFGDVDGIVERRGQLLFLEWKPGRSAISTGQRLLHENMLSIPQISIVVAYGDAETMELSEGFDLRHGKVHRKRQKADLADLKATIAKWYAWADGP